MNLFGIGPGELLLILILAFIIFGPRQLPEIGRTLGKTMRELRKVSDDLTGQFRDELEAVSEDFETIKRAATEELEEATQAMSGELQSASEELESATQEVAGELQAPSEASLRASSEASSRASSEASSRASSEASSRASSEASSEDLEHKAAAAEQDEKTEQSEE